MIMPPNKRRNGFALLEVMIALMIFAVGIIGISKVSSSALRSSVDNNNRSVSLSAASQVLIPMYLSASADPASFKASLDSFSGGKAVSSNADKDSFAITIAEAKDDAGVDVLNSATPETWISPITIGVNITYSTMNGTKSVSAPFTFYLNKSL